MIHKTTRSILSVLLAALLLVTSIPLTPAFAGDGGAVSLQSESAEGRALDGDGTKDNPYKIATADDLLEFADKVNNQHRTSAWAELTADIDLSSVCSKEKGNWTPIGNSSNEYIGTFNGAGHTISGLYIDSSDNDYKGLFGYVGTGGTVKDLSVSGTVSGSLYVGGVVGRNRGSVEDCAFTGSVSGSYYVGGVVGYNISSGNVINCTNTGDVSGTSNYVGGVVGDNDDGHVTNCYNTGKVTGSSDYSYIGGVVGYNSGSVTNCYNIDEVSGYRYVGGVVGDNSGTVENCYNIGEVSGILRPVGGVVGNNGGTNPSVTGCYFLQTIGVNESLQGIGGDKHIPTGATAEPVDDLDELCEKFKDDDTWTTSPFCEHPVLKANPEGGLGTATHPYEIKTIDQLETFRDIVHGANNQTADTDAHAVLMDDIDLSEICGESAGNWTPIGNSEENAYTGTFDGAGHTISGLYINDSTANYQGLFGYLSTDGDNIGTVQNLTVDGTVSGSGDYVGGIVGYNSSGTVTNCAFSGSVSGSKSVGGVVGENSGSNGSVEKCHNTGSVTGSEDVGGVVGHNNDGTVTGCIFSGSGSVSGSNTVGGVVGYNNGGTVTGCIFSGSGSVSGYSNAVGGVVGRNFGGTVENCYNTGTGTVTGTDDCVGGVVGLNGGTVENCHNIGEVSGKISVGGVVGDNGGTVENCYNTGKVSNGIYVGGVVGYNAVTPQEGSSVTNCYNTGSVSDGTYTGGVVGLNGASVENCYNTGSVTGSANSVGGVVGLNSGNVKNCYYQIDKGATVGIGGTTADDTTTVTKTAAEDFHSGEVAYLLQSKQTTPVWGQNLMNKPKDNYPQLRAFDADTPQVYKVAFMNDSEEHDAKYANSGMTVGSPTTNPTKEGYTFAGWFTESSGGSQWNFSTAVTKNMTLYAQWTAVEEPTPTPTPDPTPSGPSTGDSTGWDDIRDELENTAKGDEITIDMGDETKVPAEIFESLAGKDVEISFDLGDIQWSVNGADIPTDTDFTDLDLGVNLDTHGIPVNVINTITGEVGTVQITLAHNGEFGFTMTLTAPLGVENSGYWANLYHYDEDADQLTFETAAEIDADGSVSLPMSHASQYAIVIDTHSHATVDVSDLFIDIAPDAWYKDAVQYAYDNGLMTGVSDTEFAPEATTTRAMIVSILARLEGVESAEAAGFADVNDDWYATAVNWAANVGVVNGYEDGTFKPNTAITREQLAAILMNYAAYKGEDVSNRADLTSYTDQPSTWAEEAMSWAVAEGLISGVTADTLQPQGAATRAQVAAILQRFLSE